MKKEQKKQLKDQKNVKKTGQPAVNSQFTESKFKPNWTAYLVILILSFILFGNTLSHEYVLDDAIVVSENEFVQSGTGGIREIFTEELFNGFFEQKDKNLVVGGRYRPISLLTFAIEYELFMGTPFDGLDKNVIEKKLQTRIVVRRDENNKVVRFITPFRKLQKDLFKTVISYDDEEKRLASRKQLLENAPKLTDQEKITIQDNLVKMEKRLPTVWFVSHLINVLLFALTGILIFIVLTRLLDKYNNTKWYFGIPFIATVLFIAHPIHTEVVANIKGRDEILAFLGAILTLYMSLKYLETKKIYFYALVFVCFLFALFSKEVAATFIAIIPVSLFLFTGEKVKKIIYTSIPLVAATIIFLLIRQSVVGQINSAEIAPELMNDSFKGMDSVQKYSAIFFTLGYYIKLLIFPHPLTFDYYPYHLIDLSIGLSDPFVLISLFVNLALFGYVLYIIFKMLLSLFNSQKEWKPKNPVIQYGLIIYFIAIIPTSNLFFPIGVFMNERFVYGASLGFVLILAYLLQEKLPLLIKNRQTHLYSLSAIVIVILGLYSFKTIDRNTVWKNDFTLFTNDVKISVNGAKSNTSAGGKLIEYAGFAENKDKREEYLNQAIVYLKKAVEIHPEYADALILLGNAYWELNRNMDSVMYYYTEIIKLNPYHDRVRTNIFGTIITLEFDKPELADQNIKLLTKLWNTKGKVKSKEKGEYYIEFGKVSWEVNYRLGRIYGRYKNDLPNSIKYFEAARNLNPSDMDLLKDLGTAYGMTNNFEKSIDVLSSALKITPDDAQMTVNLAMNYFNLGRNDEGLKSLERVFSINLKKEDVPALMSMMNIYKNLKMQELEAKTVQIILKLDPSLAKQN
ncbi:MAG: hypothetical protein A2W91_17660 [Bacteroidetes bacterium GWF2_38_335]|nr:MAG: hypothetical protein A2W91_17660 [Bacteroidetes bacterium GWF2_38_335]OFY78039.1 MAG: hypothetical protein A2281_18800 [Bacteroidetes bacterium RIFOXYA12_FULL_38_20]HBS88311.1 hypothetical protein [Bacteroidales bacterium]